MELGNRPAPQESAAAQPQANRRVQRESDGTLKSLLIVVGIAVFFFVWGMVIYFTVGDKGSPSWYFGAVEDVPAKSPYSTFRTRRFFGSGPQPARDPLPEKQHVMGKPSRLREKGSAANPVLQPSRGKN